MQSLRGQQRRPSHPGEVPREDVLPALKMRHTELAALLGVSRSMVSQLIHEKRSLSADMAVRLATLFQTTPESWLRMQEALDLWELRQDPARLAAVKPLRRARRASAR